jgi:hypothetical protein
MALAVNIMTADERNVSKRLLNADGRFKEGFAEITSSLGERQIRFGLRTGF